MEATTLRWSVAFVVNLLLIAAVELLRRKQFSPRSQALLLSAMAAVLLAPIALGIVQVRGAFGVSSSYDDLHNQAAQAISFLLFAISWFLIPTLVCLFWLVHVLLLPAGKSSSSLRRNTGGAAQAFKFALLGGIAYAVFGYLQINWVSIASLLTGQTREAFVFDRMPPWLHSLHSAVGYGPWLIALGFLIFAFVRKRPLPFLAFLAGIIGSAIILFASLIIEPWVADIATREPFDAAAWKAENGPRPQGRRTRMVDDLLRKHQLVNMTRGQIDGLLGVPPPTTYFQNFDYVYWLGDSRGLFPIDSEWLVLKFEREIVTEARIVED